MPLITVQKVNESDSVPLRSPQPVPMPAAAPGPVSQKTRAFRALPRQLSMTSAITRRRRVTFLKPTEAPAQVTKMFDRVPPVDYVEGNKGADNGDHRYRAPMSRRAV